MLSGKKVRLVVVVLVPVIVATLLGLGWLRLREHGDTRACFRHVNCFLKIPVLGYLSELEANKGQDKEQERGEAGVEPLVSIVLRQEGYVSTLVCPSHPGYRLGLTYDDLTEDMVCYATWPLDDLGLLPDLIPDGFVLIWEKEARHAGKRHVLFGTWDTRLVGDEEFEAAMSVSRALLDALREEKRSAEGVDDR